MTVPSLRHGDTGLVLGRPVQPGQPHVEDLDHTLRRQQEIVRLDVAVDQAALTGVLQSLRCLEGIIARLVHRQRPIPCYQLRQVGPLHVLHDEQMRTIYFVGVEGADDVRVVELGGGADLALEAAHRVGVVEAFLADELEGDDVTELPVAGLEDLAHAARAQPFQQDVGAEQQVAAAIL